MDPLYISLLAFVAVAALAGYVVSLFRDLTPRKAEDRLDVLAGKKIAAERKSVTKEDLFREGLSGLGESLDKLTARFVNLKEFFNQADSPIRPETCFGISLILGLLGGMVAYLTRAPIPLYPVIGLCFAVLPFLWLSMRRARRFKKFASQLPDALELVARALRSGHGLASAMHVVVSELPPPISVEFGAAYEEQNLGIPVEKSLKNLHKRMPNMDFKLFATAVAIQRQAGGDLAEILDKISHIIRARFRIQGQVKALTGEGRISGLILMILPISLFFMVYYINPDYVMLLFTDEFGKKLIAGAAVLQVLGALCIKKIVAIKV